MCMLPALAVTLRGDLHLRKGKVNVRICCRKLYADEKAKLAAKQAAAKAAAMVGPMGAIRPLGSKPVSDDSATGKLKTCSSERFVARSTL